MRNLLSKKAPLMPLYSEEMTDYKEYVNKFRKNTTLELFCLAQPNSKEDPPPGFRTMVVKHTWPNTVTLEDVEKFQQHYAQAYNFQRCAMIFNSIGTGSFTVTWFVPVSVIGILRKSRAVKVYKEFKVSRLRDICTGNCSLCLPNSCSTTSEC